MRRGVNLKPIWPKRQSRLYSHILRLTAKQQAPDVPTNLDTALFLGTELTKMMIRMTVTESAPFRCRQGAKQRMVS